MNPVKFQQRYFADIAITPYSNNAIINDSFQGFPEDYLVVHSLIRKYKPANLLEIGTQSGVGTNIICNAMEGRAVYSIELSPEEAEISSEFPGLANIGKFCQFPFKQLLGDSTKHDYSKYYPIESWFIDGNHDYDYCYIDTKKALESNPILIIWHDLQIEGVEKAVNDAMSDTNEYDLVRVVDTRIAFAIRNVIKSADES